MCEFIKDTRIPTSLRRQAASRANGAKSHGPVTPEGKARSCQNAATHRLLAETLTFNPEEAARFEGIYSNYKARLEPRDQLEADLVDQIVVANFKLHRVWAEEISILDMQMCHDRETVDMTWRDAPEECRRALAFIASIKESNALNLLHRYARSYANQSERALKLLLEMKKQRLPLADGPLVPVDEHELRNEPSPTNEHPETDPPSPADPPSPPSRARQQADPPSPPSRARQQADPPPQADPPSPADPPSRARQQADHSNRTDARLPDPCHSKPSERTIGCDPLGAQSGPPHRI